MALLIIASVTGNTVNYWIGSMIGHKVMERDYRWIDRAALQKTHDFMKHGGKTVVLARFVHWFVPLPRLWQASLA